MKEIYPERVSERSVEQLDVPVPQLVKRIWGAFDIDANEILNMSDQDEAKIEAENGSKNYVPRIQKRIVEEIIDVLAPQAKGEAVENFWSHRWANPRRCRPGDSGTYRRCDESRPSRVRAIAHRRTDCRRAPACWQPARRPDPGVQGRTGRDQGQQPPK